MANLKSKISLQMNRFRFIKTTADESQEETFLTMHVQVIRTKLELLEDNWERFNEVHEKLCEIKSEVFLKHEYVQNGIYDQCLTLYAQAKAVLLIQREKLEKVNPPTGNQLVDVSALTHSPTTRALPEITINKFSGDYPSWRPFQDTFTSIIGKNLELTNVEKMHYLKSSLVGEAAQLIANLSVSGESFDTAWDLLVKRYENKRLLFSAQLDKLCGTQSGLTRGVVSLTLSSTHQSATSLTISAHILKTLTTWLPSFSAPNLWWSHLQRLPLADPYFLTPGAIYIILGADSYGQFIEPDVIKGEAHEPIAQRSAFGWIVLGPVDDIALSPATVSYTVAVDHDLHELLTKFWVQEEITSSTTGHLSADCRCEAHFLSTHTRDASKRYILRLPRKSPASQLGNSRHAALGSLRNLRRRLSADPKYDELYSPFIREYEKLSHLTAAPPSDSDHSPAYYLPHHGVLNEQSLTTKARRYKQTSQTFFSGFGVISSSLLRTKMFHQIKVHPDDWDLQRILWIDQQQNVIPYQLTTVIYGTRPAPFLAVRVLLQLAQDEGHKYPLTVLPLTKERYVDDIYGDSDNILEAEKIVHQLTDMCRAGGFPLSKWASNHTAILTAIAADKISTETSLSIEESSVKVLGLSWHPHSDQFQFSANLPPTSAIVSKQAILSEVAQLFDPLGFIAPVIIVAKMSLQELWLTKLGRDDALSPQLRLRWEKFRAELNDLSHLKIPRWLYLTKNSTVELHGFSDASQLAMTAVIFVKVISIENESTVTLACAKSMVAPLKPWTIPRAHGGSNPLTLNDPCPKNLGSNQMQPPHRTSRIFGSSNKLGIWDEMFLGKLEFMGV